MKTTISNTKGSSTTQYYGSNSTPCEYNAIKICVNIPPSALLATRHAQNGQTYMDQHQHFHTTQVYKCSSQQPNVALISKAMLKKGADMSSKLDNFLVDFCKKSGALNCFFLIKPKIQWLSNIVKTLRRKSIQTEFMDCQPLSCKDMGQVHNCTQWDSSAPIVVSRLLS